MGLVLDTVKIVENLVALISVDVVIDAVVDNGNSYTCETTDTQHLSVKRLINIGGTDYRIIGLEQDVSFTVEKLLGSAPDPTAQTVTLPPPFFINGTIISAKRELDNEDWKDKYPMVFLYEVYDETWIADKTNPIEFESRVRLFFMDQTRQADYTTADQYKEKVRPMRSLVKSFLDLVDSKKCSFGELQKDWRLKAWVNFGKFKAETGNIEAFFNDEVSGYELTIDLPVKRTYLDSN